MLIDFFLKLKSHRLPVSIKEYLTLLEAMGKNVIGPSVDDFYYLSRTALVKDEANYDKFDRAFGEFWQGVETIPGIEAQIPLEWLLKQVELTLSEEEKKQIAALGGWEKLMETLKARLEEQKGRHQGGSKWIGTGGTSPFGAYGYNPEGTRIGQESSRNRAAVKVWDQREYRNLDDSVNSRTRNIKVALRRLRKFTREGAPKERVMMQKARETMTYQAEISRKNPGCFLFLVDQSESMEDPFGGGEAGRKKAEELATILNKLIHNLCIRCAKSDSIYDYFHVGVLGYSEESCKPALGGELSGRSLVPISELASKPLRIEERVKKSDDGAGGVMDQTVKFPLWFDPYWKGGTPMCAALKEATGIVETWCQEHPKGFPPIVINITDGEATDGDLVAEARKLTAVSGEDGSVLLFNIHLSSTAGPSIELPGNGNKLPDQHANQLFEASSTLTPFMVARATELGMPAEENSRGFIFNAQPLHVIHFLDIDTRPANVHLR